VPPRVLPAIFFHVGDDYGAALFFHCALDGPVNGPSEARTGAGGPASPQNLGLRLARGLAFSLA
jgi:hypothetical protein